MRRTSLRAVALTAALAPAAALAQQSGPYEGHMMWDGGWHGWVFGPLMMLAFFVLAVVVVVLVVRWLTGHDGSGSGGGGAPGGGRTPLDILEERYARGEIDKDEFEERRRTLRG